jgi:DNA (cytosine-5)-methyltransferase 1
MKSFTIVAIRGRNPDNPSESARYKQKLEPNITGVSNTITSVEKDNLVLELVCQVCQEV